MNFRPGQTVRYYHAMLERSFDAKIVRTTQRGVVFEFTDKDWPSDFPGVRALTYKQAEERMTKR